MMTIQGRSCFFSMLLLKVRRRMSRIRIGGASARKSSATTVIAKGVQGLGPRTAASGACEACALNIDNASVACNGTCEGHGT